jgi:hypothetical protein
MVRIKVVIVNIMGFEIISSIATDFDLLPSRDNQHILNLLMPNCLCSIFFNTSTKESMNNPCIHYIWVLPE